MKREDEKEQRQRNHHVSESTRDLLFSCKEQNIWPTEPYILFLSARLGTSRDEKHLSVIFGRDLLVFFLFLFRQDITLLSVHESQIEKMLELLHLTHMLCSNTLLALPFLVYQTRRRRANVVTITLTYLSREMWAHNPVDNSVCYKECLRLWVNVCLQLISLLNVLGKKGIMMKVRWRSHSSREIRERNRILPLHSSWESTKNIMSQE